jgi:putative ABC transport system ATP-binding protein
MLNEAIDDYAVSLMDVRFGYSSKSNIMHIKKMHIASGGRVFLYGPSGSGKTTLLALISGILVPQQGSVRVCGQEFTGLSAPKRDTFRGSEIGYIFQGFNLIPYLTVAENIALPCELHRQRRARITGCTLQQEVERLAHRLDIAHHLKVSVTKLSAGQQQRVAIARAIIGSPALIIADEPTSSLDIDRKDAFLELLTEAMNETSGREHKKMTMIFVSHDRSIEKHFDESLSLLTLTGETTLDGARR